MSGDFLRASEFFLYAMERCEPDSEGWANGALGAWNGRRNAAACGSRHLFCDCQRCAALPEKPAWMASPEALVVTAERVVAARPEAPTAWEMHGVAHWGTDWSMASKSFMKAAKLSGESGDVESKARYSKAARRCLEQLRANS